MLYQELEYLMFSCLEGWPNFHTICNCEKIIEGVLNRKPHYDIVDNKFAKFLSICVLTQRGYIFIESLLNAHRTV